MSDWLDNFTMMGAKLNEGEKSLMRFAMSKERERIVKLLEEHAAKFADMATSAGQYELEYDTAGLIALIKGEK